MAVRLINTARNAAVQAVIDAVGNGATFEVRTSAGAAGALTSNGLSNPPWGTPANGAAALAATTNDTNTTAGVAAQWAYVDSGDNDVLYSDDFGADGSYSISPDNNIPAGGTFTHSSHTLTAGNAP